MTNSDHDDLEVLWDSSRYMSSEGYSTTFESRDEQQLNIPKGGTLETVIFPRVLRPAVDSGNEDPEGEWVRGVWVELVFRSGSERLAWTGTSPIAEIEPASRSRTHTRQAPSDSGGGCSRGCRRGNSCIDCSKTCRGGSSHRRRRR